MRKEEGVRKEEGKSETSEQKEEPSVWEILKQEKEVTRHVVCVCVCETW